MSTSHDSLADRYGEPPTGRRAVALAVAGLVVVVLAGLLAWITFFHADPTISSQEIGHEVVDDHHATIRVRIEADDDIEDPECTLRAISHDKAVVGEDTFAPDLSQGPVHRFEVRTERRATTVEWLGCRAEGQPRYR
ncbi:uncharacterized protein DUF4307 [Nocardioides sp. J9]|uniref:DUF4307 domain-containing protein n=1 Tax=unclassified Nocardioides TaxID=2615069 RepID=UPI00049191C3|nr:MULTISPECIES: DUF4307 domain-containing protein [unclassified Nocardioides]TWH03191.1 uncharacterized protein DUF4307 [Nocardioides sp. J9]